MIVVQYEHWSSGCAAAIFPDIQTTELAFSEEGMPAFGESDAELDVLIDSQKRWLMNSEKRIGYFEQDDSISPWKWRNGVMEDHGALWSGVR